MLKLTYFIGEGTIYLLLLYSVQCTLTRVQKLEFQNFYPFGLYFRSLHNLDVKKILI